MNRPDVRQADLGEEQGDEQGLSELLIRAAAKLGEPRSLPQPPKLYAGIGSACIGRLLRKLKWSWKT